MTKSIVFFIVSYSFLFLTIYFYKRINKHLVFPVLTSLSVITITILSILHYIAAVFYGSTDYDAIFFHLEYGLQGVNFLDYTTDIAICCAILLVNFLIVLLLLFRKTKIQHQKLRSFHKLQMIFGYISLLLFVVLNPSVNSVAQYVSSSVIKEKVNDNPFNQVYQTTVSSIPNKPLNLIYIYLESFERAYFDKNLYPDLLPGLTKIEDNSISFTNLTQTVGAEWTIAGMVASQCGIPLFASAGPNGTKNYDKFMPDAVCVGDILDKTGYNLSYLGGSKLSFTGKGNFYRDHGFEKIRGKKSLKSKYTEKNDYNRWGLNDDKLLDEAYQEYSLLSAEEEPFGLFLLTLGTHNPGYLSQTCGEESVYRGGEDRLLNAVKCTDKLVFDFVNKIRSSEHGSNTIIVVGSDHLDMGKRYKGKKRRNLFLVNSPNIKPQFVNKLGSTLDIAATLLEMLGFSDVKKFGFGFNLLGDTPTLVQQKDDINKYLKVWKKDIVALWSPPKFEDKLDISSSSKEAVLGKRVLKLPVILTFSPKLETEKVIYESSTPRITHQDFIAKFSPETEFLYIDSCNKTCILEKKFQFRRDDKYCMALGSLGAGISEFELGEVNTYSVKKLKKTLVQNRKVNNNENQDRINKLVTYTKFSIPEISNVNVSSSESYLPASIEIKSTGGAHFGRSFVKSHDRKTHQKYLKQGVSLFGISSNLDVKELANIDTLKNKFEVNQYSPFYKIINKFEKAFSTYFIVVHDTATHGNENEFLTYLLQKLPLKKVKNIDFETPYIGVIYLGQRIYESVGNKREAIACNLRHFPVPAYYQNKLSSRKEPLKRVAHAGGIIGGKGYTNSIDSLNQNKGKYDFFEIDFSWTSDNQLVCLHDWKNNFTSLYGYEVDKPLPLSEFSSLIQKRGLKSCDLDSLIKWLDDNPEKRIVTDFKKRNIEGLAAVARKYPGYIDRFIPQIYKPAQYASAYDLGYSDIIFTLYKYNKDDKKILQVTENKDIYAITMPKNKAKKSDLAKLLKTKRGLKIYAHTVNNMEEYEMLKNREVDEIYTDNLGNK